MGGLVLFTRFNLVPNGGLFARRDDVGGNILWDHVVVVEFHRHVAPALGQRSLRKSSGDRSMSRRIAASVPFEMSPRCRATVVRLPSEWVKTRCEVPRSGCSAKPSFLSTRTSFTAETRGALGMSEHAPSLWSAYRLEELEAGVSRHWLAISNQAP